jgi:hypothetical protein
VRAAELFAAPTFERAREIVERAGVTHLVLFSWDNAEDYYVRLARKLSPQSMLPKDAFAVALREGRLPAWLRPLAHRLPPHPALQAQRVRVFEVTEERSPVDIAVDAAMAALEGGLADEGPVVEAALALHPDSLAAVAALAGLQARRGDEPAFRRSLARAETLLPSPKPLRVEDQVRIALMFAIGGRTGPAVAVLREALTTLDERSMRRLSPATLSNLIALNDELGVTFPTSALRALATELMPPR